MTGFSQENTAPIRPALKLSDPSLPVTSTAKYYSLAYDSPSWCAPACELRNDVLGEYSVPESFPAHLGPALPIFFVHLNETGKPVMLEGILKTLGV